LDSDTPKDMPSRQVAPKLPEHSTPVEPPKPADRTSERKSGVPDEEEEALIVLDTRSDAGRRPRAPRRTIPRTGSERVKQLSSTPEQASIPAQPVAGEEEQLAAEEEDGAPSEVPTSGSPNPEEPNPQLPPPGQKQRRRRQLKKKPPEEVAPSPRVSAPPARPPEDDSDYLNALIKRTTQAVGFASLMDDDDDRRKRLQAKTRPTALGSAPVITEIKEMRTVKPVRPRPIVRVLSGEKIAPLVAHRAGDAPAQTSGWTLTGRSRSPPAHRRRYIRRPRMHMFGEIELVNAPRIFTTFKAPSIWDGSCGRIRRNSM
jgi:hypothetical protein